MLLLDEIRKQASLVSAHGYAIILSEKWQDLFEQAGVPGHLHQEVFTRWVSLDGPSKAFLWRDVDDPPNAFRLGDEYQSDHEFIARSGRREEKGRRIRKRSLKSKLG